LTPVNGAPSTRSRYLSAYLSPPMHEGPPFWTFPSSLIFGSLGLYLTCRSRKLANVVNRERLPNPTCGSRKASQLTRFESPPMCLAATCPTIGDDRPSPVLAQPVLGKRGWGEG